MSDADLVELNLLSLDDDGWEDFRRTSGMGLEVPGMRRKADGSMEPLNADVARMARAVQRKVDARRAAEAERKRREAGGG